MSRIRDSTSRRRQGSCVRRVTRVVLSSTTRTASFASAVVFSRERSRLGAELSLRFRLTPTGQPKTKDERMLSVASVWNATPITFFVLDICFSHLWSTCRWMCRIGSVTIGKAHFSRRWRRLFNSETEPVSYRVKEVVGDCDSYHAFELVIRGKKYILVQVYLLVNIVDEMLFQPHHPMHQGYRHCRE